MRSVVESWIQSRSVAVGFPIRRAPPVMPDAPRPCGHHPVIHANSLAIERDAVIRPVNDLFLGRFTTLSEAIDPDATRFGESGAIACVGRFVPR